MSPWLGFAVLIVTMVGFVAASLLAQRIASSVNEDAISIATNAAPAIQDLSTARSELVRISIAVASAASGAGADNSDGATLAAALPALREALSRYLRQPFYPREAARYAEVERTMSVLEARVSDFEAALAAGDHRRAGDIGKTALLPAVAGVDEAISRAVLFNVQQERRLGLEIPNRRRHAHQVGYVLQAFTAVCGLVLMILVFRGIRDYARLLVRARAASRARNDLLATVSHDLRNPINAISLTVGAMQRASPDAVIEKQVARIERATERMNRLIDDLLDAAKIEEGVLRIDGKPEDAFRLIESAVELFPPSAGEKSVRVAALTPASQALVHCERHLILRVLANIIANAVKFSPPGGAVVVKVEPLVDAARFSVRDEGPGIPAAHRRHVFDRYWHQRQNNRRGTGLGLYIAKGIVEAHGGRIWIEDARPGTIVSFTLPLERSG